MIHFQLGFKCRGQVVSHTVIIVKPLESLTPQKEKTILILCVLIH